MKERRQVETAGTVEVDVDLSRDAPEMCGLCFMQASGINVSVNFCSDCVRLVCFGGSNRRIDSVRLTFCDMTSVLISMHTYI